MTTQHDDPPFAVNGEWTHRSGYGWTYRRNETRTESRPQSSSDDPRFNLAMAKLTSERGYVNLSQAHALAAKDCPRGCGCRGCASTKADADEGRAAKAKRGARRVEA